MEFGRLSGVRGGLCRGILAALMLLTAGSTAASAQDGWQKSQFEPPRRKQVVLDKALELTCKSYDAKKLGLKVFERFSPQSEEERRMALHLSIYRVAGDGRALPEKTGGPARFLGFQDYVTATQYRDQSMVNQQRAFLAEQGIDASRILSAVRCDESKNKQIALYTAFVKEDAEALIISRGLKSYVYDVYLPQAEAVRFAAAQKPQDPPPLKKEPGAQPPPKKVVTLPAIAKEEPGSLPPDKKQPDPPPAKEPDPAPPDKKKNPAPAAEKPDVEQPAAKKEGDEVALLDPGATEPAKPEADTDTVFLDPEGDAVPQQDDDAPETPVLYPWSSDFALKRFARGEEVVMFDRIDCAANGNFLVGSVGNIAGPLPANEGEPLDVSRRTMYAFAHNYGAGGDPNNRSVVENSVDPTHYWCVPKQEFCFKQVEFGQFGVPAKAGETIKISQDRVFNLRLGLVSALQRVVAERCIDTLVSQVKEQ